MACHRGGLVMCYRANSNCAPREIPGLSEAECHPRRLIKLRWVWSPRLQPAWHRIAVHRPNARFHDRGMNQAGNRFRACSETVNELTVLAPRRELAVCALAGLRDIECLRSEIAV